MEEERARRVQAAFPWEREYHGKMFPLDLRVPKG